MARIDRLTKEQEALIPVVRDEWLAHGLSTAPADRATAERGVAEAYHAAGLEPSRTIVWLESPLRGCIAAAILTAWNQVWGQVRSQVRDQARLAILGSQQSDLSFYEFFTRACGFDAVGNLKGFMAVARSAGWWWPFREVVILTERPTVLSRDEQGRLHSYDGLACGYSDGWGVYAVHGVRVPAWVIEHPEQLTVDAIHREENAEVRRVMVECYGLTRYVHDAQFEILDAGDAVVNIPVWGLAKDDEKTLYLGTRQERHPRRLLRRGDLVVVELTNSTTDADGTRRVYHVQCHPHLHPLLEEGNLGEPQAMTVHNAVASTYGMRGEDYELSCET